LLVEGKDLRQIKAADELEIQPACYSRHLPARPAAAT
jgi:hypothetical protein